mmetsp:Transcript_41920/g.70851  ORF Transcript_41920/g.70851 Transcript_41920/m.70851 type:complete len:206 (-) Transcript_41920:227-844(-)
MVRARRPSSRTPFIRRRSCFGWNKDKFLVHFFASFVCDLSSAVCKCSGLNWRRFMVKATLLISPPRVIKQSPGWNMLLLCGIIGGVTRLWLTATSLSRAATGRFESTIPRHHFTMWVQRELGGRVLLAPGLWVHRAAAPAVPEMPDACVCRPLIPIDFALPKWQCHMSATPLRSTERRWAGWAWVAPQPPTWASASTLQTSLSWE